MGFRGFPEFRAEGSRSMKRLPKHWSRQTS
jgi:hypothetical protein